MGYPIWRNIKGITALFGAVVLLSCKNDVNDVYSIPLKTDYPEITATGMTLIYSDSAKIRYKVLTPEYIKVSKGDEKYEEFPKGINVTSFKNDGTKMGTLRSGWAKNSEKENLWEAKYKVVAVNEEGTTVETEQLFWDVEKERIYSTCYTRITSGERVIEGNDGFESDQDLKNPIIKNITGTVEVEKQ